MAVPFEKTLRALDAHSGIGNAVWFAAPLVLAALWGAWFFGTRMQVLVRLDSARVEAEETAHPVQALVSGYVVFAQGELAGRVEAGELLVELDSSAEQRASERKNAELRAWSAELTALKHELAAHQRLNIAAREANGLELSEAELRRRDASELARFRSEESERKRQLNAVGVLAFEDALRSASDARHEHATADELALSSRKLHAAHGVVDAERDERLAALEREAADLEGKLASSSVDLADIQREIERHRLRAPVAGRIGELLPVTKGSFVRAGDTLRTVIPEGDLRIVASAAPGVALGRIRRGQSAELRLAGFPWTAYGSVPAKVTRVASEARDGSLRVELAVARRELATIPLQHGLPGSLEIEVERTPPAALVWRSAGLVFPGSAAPP